MEQDELNIDQSKRERLASTPFKIPEDYFEKFADTLEQEIIERETPLWDKIRSSVFTGLGLAAAMIILFFVIHQTMNFLNIEKSSNFRLSEEQELLLDMELLNISETLIIDNVFAEPEQVVSDSDLIEYLMQESLEISEIVNHL